MGILQTTNRDPNLSELMTALRAAVVFGVLGLIAVGSALIYFAVTASSERAEICDVVVESVRGNAEALIATVSDLPLSAESQVNLDELFAAYRGRVDEALAPCE